jgi:hypothetical protein
MGESRRVEETMQGMAKMAVEDLGHSNTVSSLIGTMAGKARNG